MHRLSRTVIYESPWVNLYVDRVELPGGAIIERHHLLGFDRTAVMALVENEAGDILFVRVPRYATGRADWELPAGGAEPGEALIDAVRREVLEETGYTVTDPERVHEYHPMNGIATGTAHIFRCRAVDCVAGFDRDEIADVRWFSREEVAGMLDRREITDGFSLVALLLHLR
jgi:ADP-ribose pyrophosphatase